MSNSATAEIKQRIGSQVGHFVYRVPRKNHDTMMQLNKQFGEITKNYGVAHLVFLLNNTRAPVKDITNIAKTISATGNDEEWMEMIFYRDLKHKDEVAANMAHDETIGQLWQRSNKLLSSGTGFITGDFSLIRV